MTAPQTDPLAKGWYTTEFWTTLAAGAASVVGVVDPGSALPGEVRAVVAAVGGLIVALYPLSRALVKRSIITAAGPLVGASTGATAADPGLPAGGVVLGGGGAR